MTKNPPSLQSKLNIERNEEVKRLSERVRKVEFRDLPKENKAVMIEIAKRIAKRVRDKLMDGYKYY